MFFLVLIGFIFIKSTTEAAATHQIPAQLKVDGQNIDEVKTLTEVNGNKSFIPSDFIKVGSKYYYFAHIKLNWDDALDFCKNKGAKLASPLNSLEYDKIISYLEYRKENVWYLGGKKISDGNWIWSNDNSTIKFFYWSLYQPTNYIGYNCIALSTIAEFRWRDDYCTQKYNFFCQL
ncbi:hypothetical protein CHUAL_014053 [Chamberlinius hualienensis]